MATELKVGSHLITPRIGYTHHGIYIGEGRVIHYSGLSNGLDSGPVEETDLKKFSSGKGFTLKTYKNAFPPEEIVRRARSRIGESAYNVFHNNCEHFCLWCVVGDHSSPQVDITTWVSAPSVGAIAGLVGRGVIATSGSVAGLSGLGIISGLTSLGALFGGGAVSGIAVLGGAQGVAMASLVNKTVLADNPCLEKEERESRSVGRTASYVGAGAGTLGSVVAVGMAGGFSELGILYGLTTIGGTVGGGMAAGVMITTAAPVAAATAIGYGIYKLTRWAKR